MLRLAVILGIFSHHGDPSEALADLPPTISVSSTLAQLLSPTAMPWSPHYLCQTPTLHLLPPPFQLSP